MVGVAGGGGRVGAAAGAALRAAGVGVVRLEAGAGRGGGAGLLRGVDACLVCAGPFQGPGGADGGAALDACLAAGVPYVDVSDCAAYSAGVRARAAEARERGVAAVTSAGLSPGLSNVMVAEMASAQAAQAGAGAGSGPPTSRAALKSVRFNTFTSGSGGLGPASLAAAAMLCAEEARVLKDGEELGVPAASNREMVDFGGGTGKREVFLYNLPEVASCRAEFGPSTVTSRRGTSPGVANGAMQVLAALPGAGGLGGRDAALTAARAAHPLVDGLVGRLVGQRAVLRVDVEFEDGIRQSGVFAHRSAAEAAGNCAAAFVLAALEGAVGAGCWYPEEAGCLLDRGAFLERAAVGAARFELNRPSWEADGDATHIGMGIYWD